MSRMLKKTNTTTWKKVKYIKYDSTGPASKHKYRYELLLPEPLASWDVFDYWERERTESIINTLDNSDTLFDIGAEHGWLSALFGRYTKVFLIEPTNEFWPNIYETWKKNTEVDPIGCFNGFISNKYDTFRNFHHDWPDAVNAPLIDKNKYEYLNRSSKSIPKITIDELIGKTGIIPTALNIDIEGFELLALKGASRTLLTYKPKIWVSIHEDLMLKELGHTPQMVIDYLTEFDYKYELLGVDHEAHYFFY